MKVFAILAHIFGPSLALPLVAQHLLLGSNSNEVLLGVVNPNIPQGGAMNVLFPGIYQPQLQQKIAGLPQIPFGTRTGLAAQLPNQVVVPNVGTQSQLLDPTSQNQQTPNQVMSYVVSYGMPQKQGQMPVFSLYPAQPPVPALPKQIGNQPTMEEVIYSNCQMVIICNAYSSPFPENSICSHGAPTFGCFVPQINGDMIRPPGGLQLGTKSPVDSLVFDQDPTTVPDYQENKVTPEVMKTP